MSESMSALFAAAIALMILISGCKCAVQAACFEQLAVIPSKQLAVIFDKCRGEIFYQQLPPLPTDSVTPALLEI